MGALSRGYGNIIASVKRKYLISSNAYLVFMPKVIKIIPIYIPRVHFLNSYDQSIFAINCNNIGSICIFKLKQYNDNHNPLHCSLSIILSLRVMHSSNIHHYSMSLVLQLMLITLLAQAHPKHACQ